MKPASFYQKIIDEAPVGYAHHEIIPDNEGKPIDYRFIDVNQAFEKLTGLKKENLIGKTIRQVLPQIVHSKFDWIGFYGKIALGGGEAETEQYSEALEKWFRVQVYSVEKMFLTTIFHDITTQKLAEQERHKEEQTLQNYLNTTETIMVSLDNSGNITMLNRYGLELLGYKPEQIIGKNWFETVLPQPEGKNVVLPVFHRIIKGELESAKYFENDVITSSGERLSIAWRNSYHLDNSGNITGTLSSGLDITLRKQTEMELQNVRNLLELTQQLAHVGGWAIDFQGKTVAWTDETFRIHELSSGQPPDVDDAIGYYHPDDRQKVASCVQQAFEHGTGIDFEARLITAAKNERWVRVIGKIVSKDGHTNGVQGMIQDITERKRAEEAIRENEIRFSTIFNSNPAPVAITRISDNRLVDINSAWEQTTGYSREDAIGSTPADLNLWVNPEQRDQMITEISQRGKSRLEVQLRIKTGELRDMLMSAEKIELAGEMYLLSMAQDITDRLKAEKELLTSEHHAHALIAAIPDMIFRINTEGVFMDYKAAKEDLYLSPELFIGKNISEIMPGWFAQLALEKISKTIASGETIVFEYALPIHNKGDTQFECRMVPYSDNEVLSIVRNISERKEFERKIRESETNARAVMESTNDLFILLDQDGVVIDCNEAHASRLNMSRNEILGKNVFDYLPGEIAVTRKTLVDQVLNTGQPASGEDFRAGHWNEFVINPVFDQDGKVNRIAVFSRDITEKKQFLELLKEHNKTLAESEERFRKLFEDSPLGIALLKKDYRFLRANNVFCSLMGLTHEDLETLTFKDITHRDNISADLEGVRKLLSGEWQVYKTEKRYFRKDHKIVWANANISVIRNQSGEFLYFLAIIEDITQRKHNEEFIKNSEEKYRTLYERIPQGIFYQASTGKVIDTNDAALRMFGITRDQFLGNDSFDPRWKVINENNEILPPEKHPSMVALLSGKPLHNQVIGIFIPESGNYNWLIVDAIPQFRAGETTPYQVFVSMQDITQRKKTEELLRISEDRLSKSMLAANEGVWDWNLTTDEVYFDPRYYTLAGYEVNEFPHRFVEFKQRVHPEDLDGVIKDSTKHLIGESDRFQNEFRFRKKDGSYMWILGRGIIVERDVNGKPLRFVGTHQDITALKQIRQIDECRLRLLLFAETHTIDELLEETLNEVEKLTNSQIGFYHFIENDQVTIHLKNWSTQTKATYCKAVGFDTKYDLSLAGVWADCIREQKPIIHNDYAALPHKKGLPQGHAAVLRELVVPVMRSKKITAILGVGNKPVEYSESDVESVVKLADLAWDIAERKMITDELEKSKIHLSELNSTKDKFFSIIAHDLKSPFNSIIGFSDLLKEDADSLDVTDIKYYASIINNAANQTLLLLENLLNWARMQQGRMEFTLKNLLLHEIASEVIDFLTEVSRQKSITITNTIPERLVVQADENMIKTTIRNLLSNAIKFTKSGGQVEIITKSRENEIQVTVTDTGIGISPENTPKLFNIGSSFTTRGTGNEKGTGLGLVLCKEFIEKHGGRIWVESEVGKGSRFYFTLPAIAG